MTLRDLDIDVDLEVDASELVAVNARLDAMIAKIEAMNDRIKLDVELNIVGALQELTRLQTMIEALESQTFRVKIDADIAQAMAQLALLQSQIDGMSGQRIPIIINSSSNGNNGPPTTQRVTLHLDTNDAMREIAAVRAQLDALDAMRININVDIDTQSAPELTALEARLRAMSNIVNIEIDLDITRALAKLAALELRLVSMRTHTIRIDVDMGAAMAQLAMLQALMQLLNNGGGNPLPLPNLGGIGGMLGHPIMMIVGMGVKLAVLVTVLQAVASAALVAVGAIGTLGVALGLLASGALAVGGAFAVAFAGIGGAAAFVIPSIKALYDESAKLNELQQQTKTHIDSLKNAWGRFVDANQATALDLTTHGVNVLKTALTQLEPVMTAGANAIDILFHNLDAALQGNQMTAFFSSMQRQIPQMTEWIGNGIGNIARGAANLMTAFEPLTMWAGEGFANMMQRFSNWTFNLQGSEKLTAFIDYVKTNLPNVGSALGDATQGVVKFFAAFDVTAAGGLDWLADTMQNFNTWASDLGNNTGFQDMLSDIETLAPKVADAIGLISDSVMNLVDHLANGGGMDTVLSILEGVERTTSGENLLGKLLFNDKTKDVAMPKNTSAGALAFKGIGGLLFGDKGGSTLAERGIDLKVNTAGVANDITNATKGPFDVGAQVNELKPPMMINPLEIPAQVNELKPPMMIDPIDVMARASTVEVSEVTSPVNIPATVNEVTPPPTLPSLELAGRVQSIAPPPTGALPVAEMTGRVNQVEKPPTLPTMELAARVNHIEAPPMKAALPPIEVPAFVSKVDTPPTLPTLELQARLNKVEPPPMSAVTLPVKASSVDTAGLAPVRMPLSLSGTNPLSNFNWPPMPKFTFPALPSFTFPPMPTFSWPPLPKWSWPPMPKFSWPPMPKFSWPPMPTVKVNVTGAANGSHSDGLGRVPFDGYIGELHRNEAVLTASQAGTLRSMGMLKGDGERPTLDMSAAPSGGSPTYVTAAQPRSGSATTVQVGDIHITVQGGGNAQQAAINVRDELEKFFASLSDTIDLRTEG